MTAPIATKVHINGIPVQLARPMEFRLSRGWEPWKVAIPVSDTRFDNLSNPVTITIETASDSTRTASKLELEGWYISQRIRNDEFLYDLLIEDGRWAAQYNKLTKSYNIKWWGEDEGRYRQDSLNAGSPWLAVDAIKDALEQFGLEVDDNADLSSETQNKRLPNNLGNAEGGGFFGASYYEAMPLLAEVIAVDIIMKPNGHAMIVDRVSDKTKEMNDWRPISGRVEYKENKWSQPTEVVVLFQKRIERRWEYAEKDFALTTSGTPTMYGGNGYDGDIENVIPKFDADGELQGGKHVDFYEHVYDNVLYTRQIVLNRIRSTALFPWGQGIWQSMSAEDYFMYRWFEVQMQDCWRRRFRVKKEALREGEIFRPFSDIALGRLAVDGTTKSNSAVHMDYVKVNRYGHYKPGEGPEAGGSMFDSKFSDNIPLNVKYPAPFDAQWLTDDPDELIFEITPRIHKVLDRDYWPGQLKTEMMYGDIQDIADGQEIQALETTTEFKNTFNMYVYYHGLQITDIEGLGDNGSRTHRREFGLQQYLPNAEGPTLYIRVEDLTANYKFNPNEYPGDGDLLNDILIKWRAESVRDQVIDSYSGAKQGSLSFSGVSSIVDGEIITGGNVYDTVIQIGFQQEFDCLVTYLVVPQIAQIYPNKRRLDGIAPRLIEG